MLLMRAWGSRAGPADAHDARPLGASVATRKKTVHRGHAGVGGTGVRPNSASQKVDSQQSYCRDDPAEKVRQCSVLGDLALPDRHKRGASRSVTGLGFL